MTVAAAPAGPTPGGASPGPPTASVEAHLPAAQRPAGTDACPLCGTPLSPEQDWCLRCGAAARTRLAATPNWKAPIAVIAVVAVLALGVLAAALVKLSGDSSSSPVPITTTVPAPTASTSIAPATTTPTAPTTTPSTTTPGASTPTAPRTKTKPRGAGGASPSIGSLDKSSPKLTPAEREALRRLSPGTAGK